MPHEVGHMKTTPTAHALLPFRIGWKSCQWKNNTFPCLSFLALIIAKITKGNPQNDFINPPDLKIVLIFKIKQPALSFPITIIDFSF